VNSVAGFEFIWITDGIGWTDARNKLEEAYKTIPSVYNLKSIGSFIEQIKK
jgi:type II restriction enzyme